MLVELGAFIVLFLLDLVYIFMSGAVVYHFYRFGLDNIPWGIITIFVIGSLVLFGFQFIFFAQVDWASLEANFLTF